jgi:hypothetical protein
MTRLTALAVLLLVTLAILAERERRADLVRIEALQTMPVPPVHPAIVWPGGEPAPVIPPPAPHQSPPQLTIVPVPFHLDEELP